MYLFAAHPSLAQDPDAMLYVQAISCAPALPDVRCEFRRTFRTLSCKLESSGVVRGCFPYPFLLQSGMVRVL